MNKPVMSSSPIDTLIERASQQLKLLGLTERNASIEATGSPDALRYIRSRRAMPSPPRLAAIARVLKATPEWLLGDSDINQYCSRNLLTPKEQSERIYEIGELPDDIANNVTHSVGIKILDWAYDVVNDALRELWAEVGVGIELFSSRAPLVVIYPGDFRLPDKKTTIPDLFAEADGGDPFNGQPIDHKSKTAYEAHFKPIEEIIARIRSRYDTAGPNAPNSGGSDEQA